MKAWRVWPKDDEWCVYVLAPDCNTARKAVYQFIDEWDCYWIDTRAVRVPELDGDTIPDDDWLYAHGYYEDLYGMYG